MNTYNVSPMDGLVRVATVGVFALTLMCLVMGLYSPELRPMLATAALLVIVIWIGWQIAPKHYDVSDDAVIIVRGWPFKDVVIPLREIVSVDRVKLSMLTMRSFGVGGLFSHSGRFWGSGIGAFYGGITSVRDAVLITAGGKFVISPEEPDEFIRDIRVMI